MPLRPSLGRLPRLLVLLGTVLAVGCGSAPTNQGVAKNQGAQERTEASRTAAGGPEITVTRADLDAYLGRFDAAGWTYGERQAGELAGRWLSEFGDQPLLFRGDGSCEINFNGNPAPGLYAVGDNGRVVTMCRWGEASLGSHFQLQNGELIGPSGPRPSVAWRRTANGE